MRSQTWTPLPPPLPTTSLWVIPMHQPQACCTLCQTWTDLYAEYTMQNAGLDEAQTRIKISVKNINYLWYVDDTILMAENEKELKSILMRVKENSEKAGLKLNI